MSTGTHLLKFILTRENQEEKKRLYLELLNKAIDSEYFKEEDEKQIFEFIKSHFSTYKSIPDINTVEAEIEMVFPDNSPDEPWEFWLTKLQDMRLRRTLYNPLAELQKNLREGKLEESKEIITSLYRESTAKSKDGYVASLNELAPGIIERHALLQRGLIESGIELGFPYIDSITGGVQPKDAWVVVGRPETGKTYIVVRWAVGAAISTKKVLIISMEMSKEQIARRALALGANINPTSFRLGKLSYYAIQKLNDWRETEETINLGDNIIIVEGYLKMTTDDVLNKIQEYSPDLVIIDGALFLRTTTKIGSTWEKSTQIVEELKQISVIENVGLIGTYHFAKGGAKKGLEGIAFTDSIAKLGSVVIGITNEDEESDEVYGKVHYKTLKLLKGREGEKGEVLLKYDMNLCTIEEEEVLQGDSSFIER